jgi:hypothetical protein
VDGAGDSSNREETLRRPHGYYDSSCCATAAVLAVSVAIGAQTPATHRFTPERFYNTVSFAHPSALRIKPGDRVATKTIDAAGVDWNGKQVGQGPNPQIGSFYIEGAEPGDAIVVTIEAPRRPAKKQWPQVPLVHSAATWTTPV